MFTGRRVAVSAEPQVDSITVVVVVVVDDVISDAGEITGAAGRN